MKPTDSRERLVLFAIGLLILLGPVLILAVTLEILILFGDLELSQITLVEFIELYIIDLVLFSGLAYGIYRLILWLIEHQLPKSIDTLESQDTAVHPDDETE